MVVMNPNKKKTPAGSAPQRPKKSRLLKNTIFYTLIVLLVLAVFAAISPANSLEEISFSDLIGRVNNGEVAKIVESGSDLRITMKTNGEADESATKSSRIPTGASASEQGLDISRVEYRVEPPDTTSDMIWNIASIMIPMVLIVALFMWMMRSAGNQNNQSMGFGRSKAKLYGKDKKHTCIIEKIQL